MMTFTLSDEQEKEMHDWMKKHSEKCKKIIKKDSSGFIPCGGWCNYSLDILFATFANLASVRCNECGEEHDLGEV